jgi:hypothetical protein
MVVASISLRQYPISVSKFFACRNLKYLSGVLFFRGELQVRVVSGESHLSLYEVRSLSLSLIPWRLKPIVPLWISLENQPEERASEIWCAIFVMNTAYFNYRMENGRNSFSMEVGRIESGNLTIRSMTARRAWNKSLFMTGYEIIRREIRFAFEGRPKSRLPTDGFSLYKGIPQNLLMRPGGWQPGIYCKCLVGHTLFLSYTKERLSKEESSEVSLVLRLFWYKE